MESTQGRTVAVRARALVTLRIERSSTKWTQRSTRFDESRDRDGERARPLLGQREYQRVILIQRFERQLDRLVLFVDADGYLTGVEVRFVFRFQCEVIGQVPRTREVRQHLTNPFGERAELDLLALHYHQTATLSRLEQKETIAYLAAHTDHYFVGCAEHVVHETTNSFSDPVELTHNTIGVPEPIVSALTEHVEMTVRWNRSSGTPWA